MRWPLAIALGAVLVTLSAGSIAPEGSGVFVAAADPPAASAADPVVTDESAPGVFVPPVKRSKPVTPALPNAESVPLPERKPPNAGASANAKKSAEPAASVKKTTLRERSRTRKQRLAEKESRKRR